MFYSVEMLVEADVAARPPRDDHFCFFSIPKSLEVAFPAGIVRAPAVRTTNTAAQREEGLHGVRFTPSPRDLVRVRFTPARGKMENSPVEPASLEHGELPRGAGSTGDRQVLHLLNLRTAGRVLKHPSRVDYNCGSGG